MKYVKTFESWLKNMFKTDNDSIESYNSRTDYRVFLNRWNDENINESRNPPGHWTKEKCQEEALKYNSRNEFRKNSGSAYIVSQKNGWLDEICSHMDELRKPDGYWTKEKCQEEALKYNSRSEFQKNSPAYNVSRKNGWLDEICSHMVELKKPNGHWTKERCQEEALKYNSRSEFEINSGSAYGISLKNGWLDEICSHMVGLQKPSGYWTKEKCQEEALKYNSRTEFRKNSPAFQASFRKGWIDEICSHMVELRTPNGHWTKEKCQEEALKYNSRSEFHKNSGTAYGVSLRNGWIDEICSHMVGLQKPSGYWTKEKCQEEALKYNSRSEFQKNSSSGYKVSLKNGWIDEICSHMVGLQKPSGYWTKERCHEEALKYNSKNEFHKNSGTAYGVSLKNGWLDEICSHMSPLASLKKRYIYSYEFSDKSVYVGLTWNTEDRKRGHEQSVGSQVNKHIKNNPHLSYEFKIWGYYDMLEVGKMEEEKEKEYIDSGWVILNIAKTGGLGGMTRKWTKEKCQEEALKYNSRSEFSKNSGGAYNVSRKNGWFDEICSHMVELQKPHGHWTKERCQEEALKYNSRSEFQRNSPSAYGTSLKNGWLDEICSHMVELHKPNNYWTKERCQEEALKYNSLTEFHKNSGTAYNKSRKEGWLDEICSHMVELKKPDGYWTKERCQEEALKYNSRTEFKKNSPMVYEVSRRNGWIDEICSHMVELQKPSGHWTKERCQEEALKYNSRIEFSKNSVSAYNSSRKNGWLDEICSHMNTKK